MSYPLLTISIGTLKYVIGKPIKAELKNEGVPYSLEQMIILKLIKTKCLIQQDIAEKMGKDKSVILRIIDTLEKENLLIRVVDPNDRRRNILETTSKGNEMIDLFSKIETKVSDNLLKGIPEKDVNTFFSVIEQIKENSENQK